MVADASIQFGQFLKTLRKAWTPREPERDEGDGLLTQQTLGHRVGVSANYISMFERGERSPNPYLASRLAKALDLDGDVCEVFLALARDAHRANSGEGERSQASIEEEVHEDRQPDRLVAALPRDRVINRPPDPTPRYFQGRQEDTRAVAEYIRDESIRLVSVVGRSGAGKTVLVCRLLRAMERGLLPDGGEPLAVDGIVYLGKGGLTVANLYASLCKLLLPDLAHRFDERYRDAETDIRTKFDQLLAAFSGWQIVVLLDNFEDLLDDQSHEMRDAAMSDALHAFLSARDLAATIVLTTQWATPSLVRVQPGRQVVHRLKGLKSPDAENLLRERDRTSELGLKNAPDELLQEAQKRTDGYPRALEALCAIFEVDQDASLQKILDDTERVLPEHVQWVLIGEVFSRLDPTAQKVIQALAIFNRPVTPDAIDYLLRPWLPSMESAPILKRLVNLTLVQPLAGRYSLHTTDRAYALSQIPEGTVQDRDAWTNPARVDQSTFVRFALRDRAASYFREIRTPRETWKKIDDLEPLLAEFDLRYEAGEHETAARVLREMAQKYLLLWGHYEHAAEMYERLRGHLTDPDLQQHWAGYLARCYATQGRLHEAIELVKQASAITKQEGDQRGHGRWLNSLSVYYGRLGQTRKAIAIIEGEGGALEMARETTDGKALGARLHNLAIYYARLGEVPKAKELVAGLYGAIPIALAEHDHRAEGIRLGTWAELEIADGNFEKAITLSKRAISIAEELNSPVALQFRHYYLARALLEMGNLVEARDAAQRACEFDVPRHNSTALTLLGIIAWRQGDRAAAREAFEEAVKKAGTMLERTTEAYAALQARGLACCGLVLLGDSSRLEEAIASFRAARTITNDRGVVNRVLHLLDILQADHPDERLTPARLAASGHHA